jgi:DNA-binding MarR family transcriptional regulator
MESGLEGSVGYQLKRAQHALRLRVDAALKEVGLTTPQYAALSVLEETPGLSGAALARRSFVTPQTMNVILAKLEGAGLIERSPHPEHGRVLQTYLTDEGRGLVSGAHDVVAAVEESMLASLGRGDRVRLAETLNGCADRLT